MIFAVDFDGTIVKHRYPEIGQPVPGALGTLVKLVDSGHYIILHTSRTGAKLDEAVKWLDEQGIPLYGVNANPLAHTHTSKPFASMYIDDAALGCPTRRDDEPGYSNTLYVDWFRVSRELERFGYIPSGQS